ncbi:MAG: D-alanyl-D-alanine carboxypeptidase/D-alanyl-D-alanine-endopeptidase [Bacteroidetes bacterium]|nr:D-alanyl-D-alanine carboxypeptidase/D-alanyl-D-alanine-endopeptidase [Bacteroidota bacterium]
MRTILLIISVVIAQFSYAQDVKEKLQRAITLLEQDAQFRHSIISLYVTDGKTGNVIFDLNGQKGLAPASCQKIVTSAAAFELLGKSYTYTTRIGMLQGDSARLVIEPSGDPTLGSKRWKQTQMNDVYDRIWNALKKNNVTALRAGVVMAAKNYPYQSIPDGWVWQDIGNYFGAGASLVNWNENQYSISLQSGEEGSTTKISSFDPTSATFSFKNFITAGKQGSGDNAWIYAAPYGKEGYATGTIPPNQKSFSISGSMPDPTDVFLKGLQTYLENKEVRIVDGSSMDIFPRQIASNAVTIADSIVSPPLDSINYWFLKKSVNLFGEAFVKTIAYNKAGIGSTDSGVHIIREFWASKGIEKSSLKIIDGSGLSPANRLTTASLVAILQYAKKQSWFSSFYNALPEMNNIKMKDGYIGGVRSYAGYVTSARGKEYCFSFIVNNFDGSPATAREKIWKLLDILK